MKNVMVPNVVITEKRTGRVAATIPISLHGQNYTPSEAEYFAKAWKIAVSDKTVDPQRKDDYSFELREAPLKF
jgi:hypothetical protein